MHRINPEAVRTVGYFVTDTYVEVVENINSLNQEEREFFFSIIKSVLGPLVEKSELLEEIGQDIIEEVENGE